MFDKVLKEELLNYKKGCYNLDSIEYWNNQYRIIIKCRSQDKLYFIKTLLDEGIIDVDYYTELYSKIKSDYRKANLYLRGLCQI